MNRDYEHPRSIRINCIFTRDVFPQYSTTVTIFRTFVIPKRNQLANNSLSREIPEFELISRIYRMILMHSALPIQYPRRFIVIIFKKDNRSPVDRDQVTKIRVYRIIQFEQFLHEYPHPISISKARSIWNYFSNKDWKRNGIIINEINEAFLFSFSFFFCTIWTGRFRKIPFFMEYRAKIERIWYPVMRNES